MNDDAMTIALVQQGVRAMPLQTMPLASGYLKAALLADGQVGTLVDPKIYNFDGADSQRRMVREILSDRAPDVLACSVQGWSAAAFRALATTYKQMRPDGLVVFGGTHVALQATDEFQRCSAVDVIVNGEGESTLPSLVRHYLESGRADLDQVGGISLRTASGSGVLTTPDSGRISDLDLIPSPILTDAIPLTDESGAFLYDVGLMETNRGCPYHCSFCYWGGAVGQRVRSFSRQRLRSELELFAQHGVETIVLCDANFGMLPQDLEFVEDAIDMRQKYGFPNRIETSWAKNKGSLFYTIVERLSDAKMQSSFTLALQSLSDDVLNLMNRRNMKVNDWKDLVSWLEARGLDLYAELIWGAPGETPESFLRGYDELAEKVERVATYPLVILPNTSYQKNRAQLGLITLRGENDDFEYVVAHPGMTMEENRLMQGFILWSRLVAEYPFFRNVWRPLFELAQIKKSYIISSLRDWFALNMPGSCLDTTSLEVADDSIVRSAVRFLHVDRSTRLAFETWFNEIIEPLLPIAWKPLLRDVFYYDLATLPIFETGRGGGDTNKDATIAKSAFNFSCDVPRMLAHRASTGHWTYEPHPWTPLLSYKQGFVNHVDSHEVMLDYVGVVR